MPVVCLGKNTTNSDIIINLNDKSDAILSVSATFKKWNNKAQTVTVYSSSNSGSDYNIITSSENFSISSTTLPENTNSLKFSFATKTNQIGVSQICVRLKSMPASRVVTISDVGYATFCPLYDSSIEKEDGAQIYYVSDWSANSLTLKEYDGTTLRRGTGIILRGAQKRVRFTETVLSAAEESESAGIYTKNKLRGTTEQTSFGDNEVFILAQPADCSVGFYPNRSGVLAAEKAYIDISEWSADNDSAPVITETTAQRCALTMCHEGGATAVTATTGRVTGRSGMGYNLAGQQVSGSYDGIVVRDGRKIISRRSGRGCSR